MSNNMRWRGFSISIDRSRRTWSIDLLLGWAVASRLREVKEGLGSLPCHTHWPDEFCFPLFVHRADYTQSMSCLLLCLTCVTCLRLWASYHCFLLIYHACRKILNFSAAATFLQYYVQQDKIVVKPIPQVGMKSILTTFNLVFLSLNKIKIRKTNIIRCEIYHFKHPREVDAAK